MSPAETSSPHASEFADAAPSLLSRADLALAAAACTLTFAVYVHTMYPDIFGGGDATKFAFVGKVLGTPHAPGYPLYVMVAHLFSYLPWGTLAHRMNGMSGLFGGVAVALTYLLARLVGIGPLAAMAGALSLGFGNAFWGRAVYAKTYTLNATLVSGGLAMLVLWGRTRRRAHLHLSIAIFALSLGNHLIVISLVPALVVYALVTDWRAALSWRTILFTIAAIAISLCQYLLIIVRTLQNAPYLEARAANLQQLLNILMVRRWSHEIGAYTWPALLHVRVPVMAGLVGREMEIGGLLVLVIGAVALARRRWREALLAVLGAAGVLALTANMSSNEDQGFLLPAFVLLWVLAAAGFDALVGPLLRRRPVAGPLAGAVTAAALVVACAVPASLVAANYRVNDHHDRTYETRYFDALFRILPDGSALVDDRYTVNMMLKYKLLGEDAAHGRNIEIILPQHGQVDRALANGEQVFAFSEGQRALSALGYEFAPVALKGPRLAEFLPTIPDSWTVAFAATTDAAPVLRDGGRAWRRFGVDARALFGRPTEHVVAVIASASRHAAVQESGPFETSASVGAGEAIAGSSARAPVAITAAAGRNGATVSTAGVERATVQAGAVLGLVEPDGHTSGYTLDPSDGLRVPVDMAPLPLYVLTAASTCVDIGNRGWIDATEIASRGTVMLRIDNYRPFLSHTIFYVGGDAVAHAQFVQIDGAGQPQIATSAFRTGDRRDAARLAAATAADAVVLPEAMRSAPVVSRVDYSVNDEGGFSSVQLDLGLAPTATFVKSTVDLNNPKRATLCGRRVVTPDQRAAGRPR